MNSNLRIKRETLTYDDEVKLKLFLAFEKYNQTEIDELMKMISVIPEKKKDDKYLKKLINIIP